MYFSPWAQELISHLQRDGKTLQSCNSLFHLSRKQLKHTPSESSQQLKSWDLTASSSCWRGERLHWSNTWRYSSDEAEGMTAWGPSAVREIQSDSFFSTEKKHNGLGTLCNPHQSKFGLSVNFKIRGRMKMYCTAYFKILGEFKDCFKAEFISSFANFVQNTLLVSQEPLKHTQTSKLWWVFNK